MTKGRGVDPSRPITWSSLADATDWAIDMDNVDVSCAVSDQRGLSRYAFQHMVTLPMKTMVLLFVLNRKKSRRSKALRVESIFGTVEP